MMTSLIIQLHSTYIWTDAKYQKAKKILDCFLNAFRNQTQQKKCINLDSALTQNTILVDLIYIVILFSILAN